MCAFHVNFAGLMSRLAIRVLTRRLRLSELWRRNPVAISAADGLLGRPQGAPKRAQLLHRRLEDKYLTDRNEKRTSGASARERSVTLARCGYREGSMTMMFTLFVSIFFGLVAAAALIVNGTMALSGLRAARAIRGEIAAIDRVPTRPSNPIRRGQLAF